MVIKIQNASTLHKKIFGLIVGFCALIVNIYSLYLHSIIDFTAPTTGASIATLTWILSIIFFGFSIFIFFSPKKTKNDADKRLSLMEKVFLTGMLIFGLILRVYKLNHLGLYLDEWYWLTNARSILDGVIRSPFGFIGDQPSNMPASIVAFFLAIFKNSYLAVRFPGVLYSILNIILVFSFLREAFNKKVALLAALLLALSIWDIHMSQFGWNNVNLNPFLISGTMFFLYRGIKNLSVRDIFICGIFLGVSINLLYIASLSSIAVILYFIYSLLLNEERGKIIVLLFLLTLTVSLIVSPTIIKIYKYPQQSIARHKNFVSENITYSKNQTGVFYYLEQLKLGVEDFTYKSEKFNIIMLWGITLEPFVFYCFIIGLLYSLRYIARPPFFLILLNYVVMFIPIVVLYRFTSVWREFGFLPTIYILSSFGVYLLYKLITRLTRIVTPQPLRPNSQLIALVIIIATYFTSWYYFYAQYFNYHLKKEPKIYETYCKKTAEYISKTIPANTLIILPNELCNSLITIALGNKYRYQVYNNEVDLMYVVDNARKEAFNHNNVLGARTTNGVFVQIADSNFLRYDVNNLKKVNTQYLSKRTIIEDDNTIYSYLYNF